MPEHIRLSPVTAAVVTLTLDRPEKKNALSIALRDEVTAALGALAADPQVKAVVITGAGDVFSAGFDLDEFKQAGADAGFRRRVLAGGFLATSRALFGSSRPGPQKFDRLVHSH